MTPKTGLRLAIDIGGTFTDTVLTDENNVTLSTAKTPTTPDAPADAALEGAHQVIADAGAAWSGITGFVHGTTLATNALIERRGARVATITTDGFRDILEIAYERRYSQYAINIDKPDLIVPRQRALTIAGRIDASGTERVPLDEAAVPALASRLKELGIDAVAICLLHSYANPSHEQRLGVLLADALPGLTISLSHEVSPEAREFDRLCTTIANAYIQPLMAGYLADFQARFARSGLLCPILMMTAGGGMTTLETAARLPVRLVESGPAGGAILAADIARETGERTVLSFDMGGTTAKLCLIDDYRPQTARRFEIARAERFVSGSGMPVRIPVVEMIEIGAGGGSIASVDRLGRISTGPQSAGSVPGPAAFGRGGVHATVTDADVVQGYIEPERFAEGRLRIDETAARDAVVRDAAQPLGLAAEEAAQAISGIVDESMAAAGRMHAVESGKDLGARVMIAFGGNGPLHATRVARRSGVRHILIPRSPGVGSALGFLRAPVSFEVIRSRYATLTDLDVASLNDFFRGLFAEAAAVVRAGAPDAALNCRRTAFMRYHGQGHEIEVLLPDRDLDPADISTLKGAFEEQYSKQFSRTVPGMTIEILNWSLTVTAAQTAPRTDPGDIVPNGGPPIPSGRRRMLCDVTGQVRMANVYDRTALSPGDMVDGPALIVEAQTTTLVSADFTALADAQGNMRLTRKEEHDI